MAVAALVAAVAATTGRRCPFDARSTTCPLGIQILFSFALVNLFLGLFNLLPIPPLDGSALIERVLPETWLPHWYRFRPYGFLVLFLLVFSHRASSSDDPRPVLRRSSFDFVFVAAMKLAAPRPALLRRALARAAPRADDVAWVESVLTPDGVRAVAAACRTTTAATRSRVARDVEAQLAGTDVRRRSALARRRAAARRRQARRAASACSAGSSRRWPARPPAATWPTRGREARGSPARRALPAPPELGAERIRLRRRPRGGRACGPPPTTTPTPGRPLEHPDAASIAALDRRRRRLTRRRLVRRASRRYSDASTPKRGSATGEQAGRAADPVHRDRRRSPRPSPRRAASDARRPRPGSAASSSYRSWSGREELDHRLGDRGLERAVAATRELGLDVGDRRPVGDRGEDLQQVRDARLRRRGRSGPRCRSR